MHPPSHRSRTRRLDEYDPELLVVVHQERLDEHDRRLNGIEDLLERTSERLTDLAARLGVYVAVAGALVGLVTAVVSVVLTVLIT